MTMKSLLLVCLLCSTLLGCEAPPAGTKPQPNNPSQSTDTPANEESDLRPAAAGVGRQGQGYGGGPISEPIRQRFLIEQRLTFEVQIKQAISLYKAQSLRGRGPDTHDDFMRLIVQANNIKLPELPDGERYLYDPATEQLMVERISKVNVASPVAPD